MGMLNCHSRIGNLILIAGDKVGPGTFTAFFLAIVVIGGTESNIDQALDETIHDDVDDAEVVETETQNESEMSWLDKTI